MVRKFLSIALLGATAITVTSCNAKDAGFKKTANGLEYKIVSDSPGIQKPAIGDYIEFHFKSYVHTAKGDSLLIDSREVNMNQAVMLGVTPPAFKGDLMEGLMMLTKGDTAVFQVSLDSMMKGGGEMMPWMKKLKDRKMEFRIRVANVKTAAQLQEEQKAKSAVQFDADEKVISDYLAKNGIKATRTASGLFYKVDKQGAGPVPTAGSTVTMNYTGTTLDGTKFDSNVDPKFNHVEPFTFKLGVGQVIKGWDEGIALLPKGTKATLYIPSPLAYGSQSPTPAIQPNSVLIFDVEVVDFK
jgi:FKBP-type peptidyl-prolyl cis-trans isomerase